MKSTVKDLVSQGDELFGKRSSLLSFWQEVAENFYPQRADFTVMRSLGAEFASNLTTSYPILAQRALADSFSGMLRPRDKLWAAMYSEAAENDNASKRWLEWASQVQKRAMYDRKAGFIRATKEGDGDFSAFGQCVISTELNRDADALLYRCWHLRDVAWAENNIGVVETFHRRWAPTTRTLCKDFGDKVHGKVKEALKKEPNKTFNVRHIVMPSEDYNEPKFAKYPYVSIYIDIDNEHIMEEVGLYNRFYTLPRWQTVSGSQYAYSPATVAALPDARLIQAMTLTLLEAGEKAVNPPMVAVQEAIRSDIAIYSGAITYVDAAYDERLGEALRPIAQNINGIPLGLEMAQDTREMIKEAFYLNKITMPPAGGDMTAYEVSQRIQEYIRGALPLFEPMEIDYNGSLCEITFEILKRSGTFGDPRDIPERIRGQSIEFKFTSPLVDAAGQEKGQKFREAQSMLAEVSALDPTAPAILDARTALRDTLDGIGIPSKWINDDKKIKEIENQMAQAQQTQQMLATMEQGSGIAESLGKASKSMSEVRPS